jgi:hypothetical protein
MGVVWSLVISTDRLTAGQLLLSDRDQPLANFSTYGAVGTGGCVRSQLYTEFLCNFKFELIQGSWGLRSDELFKPPHVRSLDNF